MAVHKLCDKIITAAMTGETIYVSPVVYLQQNILSVLLQAVFDYGSGGTNVDAYVQTSLDGGVTWGDVCNFRFTTGDGVKTINLSALTAITTAFAPQDGAMSTDTCKDGFIGQLWRVKLKSSGTYAGNTNLKVFGSFKAAAIG